MCAGHSKSEVPAEAERSGVIGSPQPVCAICGGPRDRRKREACSDKCRAALSRRRRALTQTTRDQETRAALEAIARLVQGTLRRLEKGGPPCAEIGSRGGVA
jgi:predicted nucleic acid-binding Zn ribbon protein